MATIQRFEELWCWKKSRELTKEVYEAFKFCRDHGFRDQIQRASVSVMSNIAEGFESGTRQEFINYLFIARASAGEVRAQLYAAHDIGYLNIERFEYLKNLAEECSRLITSFIHKVKSGAKGGLQYKPKPKIDPMKDFYIAQGWINTLRGARTRESAEKDGLEIIPW